MTTFIYDGSFDGLLQCIHDSYMQKCVPDAIISEQAHTSSLMSTERVISLSPAEYEKVRNAIRDKLGNDTYRTILRAFLSDRDTIPLHILHYVRLGFSHLPSLKNRRIPSVKAIEDAALQVGRENHKYTGFVRFQRLEDDLYYAPIQPQCNILPLLATHFRLRLPVQRWIIHDTGRALALIHQSPSIEILPVTGMDTPVLHHEEKEFQHLWKCFFEHVAIKERHNPSCQQNHVPLRYRPFLTEFQA